MRFSPTKILHGLLLLTSLLLASCGGGGGSSGGGGVTVTPPAAPAGVSTIAGCNATMMYINWNAASGATGYNVYRSNTTGVAGTKITATPVVANSYTDSGLTAGATYYYTVTSVNSGGESTVSTEVPGTTQGSTTCTQMGGSFQGNSLALTTAVTTFAGTAGTAGSTDGTGAAARFSTPAGTTTDATNLYVADTANHTIRKIVIATGVVSTLAGSAGTSGSTDATGADARFNGPKDVTTDGTNLYVADTGNHTIRQIVISSGLVSTLAGTAGSAASTDDTGAAARFNSPQGITTDGPTGPNLYVADTGNHTIRQIVISSRLVSTLAGTAGTSGITNATGTAAKFNSPQGITTDGTNFYVADTANHTIRKIDSSAAVTTLAGTAGVASSADGIATAAEFNFPQRITTDGTNLYVADTTNHTIRKIVLSTGVVTTLAGTALSSGSTDATGTAARFNTPAGITTDGTYLYAVDAGNHIIRKIQ